MTNLSPYTSHSGKCPHCHGPAKVYYNPGALPEKVRAHWWSKPTTIEKAGHIVLAVKGGTNNLAFRCWIPAPHLDRQCADCSFCWCEASLQQQKKGWSEIPKILKKAGYTVKNMMPKKRKRESRD